MTKEQFNTFKREFKIAVELTKLDKKYCKGWKKAGFESKEDFEKSYPVYQFEREELSKQITKTKNAWCTCYAIYGHKYTTHWAYYCAKHQLSDEEIEKYVKEQYSKLKNPDSHFDGYGLKLVQRILEIYGTKTVL